MFLCEKNKHNIRYQLFLDQRKVQANVSANLTSSDELANVGEQAAMVSVKRIVGEEYTALLKLKKHSQ